MASIIYNAGTYAKLNRIQRTSVFRQIAQKFDLIFSLNYPAKVVDVGCGTGENTKLLTYFNNIAEIDAIDFAPDMIEYAKINNFDNKVKYHVADAENRSTWPPTAKDNSYDLAVSFYVLHWISRVDKVLANVQACLKPGGYLLAKMAGHKRKADQELVDFIKTTPRWGKYAAKHTYADHAWINVPNPAEEFSKILKNSGFGEISCENVYPPQEYFYNKDEVKGERN